MEKNLIWIIASVLLAAAAFAVYWKRTGFHKTSNLVLVGILLLLPAVLSVFVSYIGPVIVIVAAAAYYVYFRRLTSGMKADEGEWVYWEDFEDHYAALPEDESGCYVITSFTERVKNNDYRRYETAYVGSSSSINKEVHSVLNNKMLSRVYDDIQKGNAVYIKIVPATSEHINSIQEKLITMYNGVPYLLSFKEVREKQKKTNTK